MNKIRRAKVAKMNRTQLVEALDHAWKLGDHLKRKLKAQRRK